PDRGGCLQRRRVGHVARYAYAIGEGAVSRVRVDLTYSPRLVGSSPPVLLSSRPHPLSPSPFGRGGTRKRAPRPCSSTPVHRPPSPRMRRGGQGVRTNRDEEGGRDDPGVDGGSRVDRCRARKRRAI